MSNLPPALQARRRALEEAYAANDEDGVPTDEQTDEQTDEYDMSEFEVDVPSDDQDEGETPPEPAPVETTNVFESEPASQPKSDDWEQKYRTLQGMYRKKDDELKDLAAKVASMQAALDARPAQPQAAPPTRQAPVDVELTEHERQEYAASLPVITKVAKQVAGSMLDGIEQRLAAMEGTLVSTREGVESAVTGLAKRSFQSQLATAVPDKDTLAKDPAFAQFLKNPIPYSGGQTLHDRLRDAYKSQDIETITAICNDYRTRAGKPASRATPEQFAQPDGGVPQPQVPAARQQRKLRWSSRQKAFADRRAGLITAQQLDVIAKKFAEAESKGLVDYNA